MVNNSQTLLNGASVNKLYLSVGENDLFLNYNEIFC